MIFDMPVKPWRRCTSVRRQTHAAVRAGRARRWWPTVHRDPLHPQPSCAGVPGGRLTVLKTVPDVGEGEKHSGLQPQLQVGQGCDGVAHAYACIGLKYGWLLVRTAAQHCGLHVACGLQTKRNVRDFEAPDLLQGTSMSFATRFSSAWDASSSSNPKSSSSAVCFGRHVLALAAQVSCCVFGA